MSLSLPHYVFDAYVPFKASEGVILNPKSLGNLKTALRLYILPSYGFEADHLQGDRELETALGKVTLKAFLNAPDRLQSSAAAERSVGTMANYRSAINRFLGWMEQQSWFRESVGRFEEMVSPTTKVVGLNLQASRRGTGKDWDKDQLALAKAELTPQLRQELIDLLHDQLVWDVEDDSCHGNARKVLRLLSQLSEEELGWDARGKGRRLCPLKLARRSCRKWLGWRRRLAVM